MTSNLLARAALALLAAAACGCATIVAKSSQTITITSVPEAAAVTVTNAAGLAVHNGTTPVTVALKKGRGYFKPESYLVRVSKDGYQPREVVVKGQVNGWYFGNILFGGLIGMLAVDPATGAMYTLRPDAVGATLEALKVRREVGRQTLTVMLIEDLPPQIAAQLIPISNN